MIYRCENTEEQAILQTAAQMCAAARTAPKTRGIDTIHTLVLTGEDKDRLVNQMEQIGKRLQGAEAWYTRDAANVKDSQAVVLIGVENTYRTVQHCGFCGFETCAANAASGGRCAFAMVDLGIAVSSAVGVASMCHVDNRIMYSIGKAAEEMKLIPQCLWLGIPLSVTGKSIFFDRK